MRFQQSYSPGGAARIPCDLETRAMETEAFQLFSETGHASKSPTHLYVSILLRLADFNFEENSALILDKVAGEGHAFQVYLSTTPDGGSGFTFNLYAEPGPTVYSISLPSERAPDQIPQTIPVLVEFVADLDKPDWDPYLYAAVNRAYVSSEIAVGATDICDEAGKLQVWHSPTVEEPDLIIEQLVIANTFPEWFNRNWEVSPVEAFNFVGGNRDGFPWWYRVMEPRNYSHVYEFDKGNEILDYGYYSKPFVYIDSGVSFVEGDYGMTLRPEKFMEQKGNESVSKFKFLRPYYTWRRRTS